MLKQTLYFNLDRKKITKFNRNQNKSIAFSDKMMWSLTGLVRRLIAVAVRSVVVCGISFLVFFTAFAQRTTTTHSYYIIEIIPKLYKKISRTVLIS